MYIIFYPCTNSLFILSIRSPESIDVKLSDNNGSPFRGMGKEELLQHSSKPFWRRLRMICISIILLGWLALIITVVALVLIYPKCKSPDSRSWWQNEVIYRIYVRSYKDSNGDGVGDLDGKITNNCYYGHHLFCCQLLKERVCKRWIAGSSFCNSWEAFHKTLGNCKCTPNIRSMISCINITVKHTFQIVLPRSGIEIGLHQGPWGGCDIAESRLRRWREWWRLPHQEPHEDWRVCWRGRGITKTYHAGARKRFNRPLFSKLVIVILNICGSSLQSGIPYCLS